MRRIPIVLAALLLAGHAASASELGHYAPGVLNIRDFFVPEPGWYAVAYGVYYGSDVLRDRNGDRVRSITIGAPPPGPGVTRAFDVDLDLFTVAPTFIGVAPWKLPWGGRYAAYVSPSFANSRVATSLATLTEGAIQSEEGQFGAGDLFVQPIWLGWSGPHWDLSLGYGFYAPVGRYRTEKTSFPSLGISIETPAADNIGLGFWTHQFQTAAAWYPWEHRGTAVAMALTGEVHGEKQGIDVIPGSHLSWNWGISQYLPLVSDGSLILEIGPTGYSQWQVSDDTGSAARDRDVHDQVHAAGVQLGLTFVPWNAFTSLRYLHEFAAEDRFEGRMLTLSVGKKFF